MRAPLPAHATACSPSARTIQGVSSMAAKAKRYLEPDASVRPLRRSRRGAQRSLPGKSDSAPSRGSGREPLLTGASRHSRGCGASEESVVGKSQSQKTLLSPVKNKTGTWPREDPWFCFCFRFSAAFSSSGCIRFSERSPGTDRNEPPLRLGGPTDALRRSRSSGSSQEPGRGSPWCRRPARAPQSGLRRSPETKAPPATEQGVFRV